MGWELEAAGVSPAEIRQQTGASRAQLRYWEQHGYVKPIIVHRFSRKYRRYDDIQAERIQRLRRLLDQGYTLAGAIRRLDTAVTDVSGISQSPAEPQQQAQLDQKATNYSSLP